MKVGLDGHLIWQKAIGIAGNLECGNSMCVGPNGGYILYGARGSVMSVAWIAQLDSFGNLITDTIFGGVTGFEEPASVLPYLGGYVATGVSSADSFNMGTSYGAFATGGGGAYVSYINLSPLIVKKSQIDNNTLTIFPNPTSNSLTIRCSCAASGNLSVTDIFGIELYNIVEDAGIQNITINTINWNRGLYLLRWIGANGTIITTKFSLY